MRVSQAPIVVHHALRVTLGLVFFATGGVKLLNVAQFVRHLGDFGIVPDRFVATIAWLICFAEITIGLSLIAKVRWSLLAVFSLLLLFVGVLIYGVVIGLDIDCGCLGPAYSVELRTQLAIDCILLACCGLIYVTGGPRRVNSDHGTNFVTEDTIF